MLLETSALVLSLLQDIEAASHAEPPVFQMETLLETARLLPAGTYGKQRREFLESAVRLNAGIHDEASRYLFLTEVALLLTTQDAEEAGRLCRQIPAESAKRCWEGVDPEEGKRLPAAAPQKQKPKAKEPEKPKQARVPAALQAKMNRSEDESLPATTRSQLYREVLDESESIADPLERLMNQGYIAAWFAAQREEATAALAAAKLQKSFAEFCRCEDVQCDSVEGRADCSELVSDFVEYLAQKKIDPAVLAIRHPTVAARVLVYKLKEALR